MSTQTRYSKTIIEKIITGENGELRKYQTNKLGAKDVSIEGFKLLKALAPSAGVGIDTLASGDAYGLIDTSQTYTAMLQLLSENLTEDHFAQLEDKLLGCLTVDGKKIEDWSDHFDLHEGDFLEVLGWIGKETFTGFFSRSTILKYWIRKIKELVPANVKGKLENIWKEANQDPS